MYRKSAKRTRGAALVALAAATACKGAPDSQQSAYGEEKMNLLTNPSLFLPSSDREYEGEDGPPGDAGAWSKLGVDTDHRLTSMVVSNTSHFAVGELSGDVVWFDDQDRRIGSTPFSLSGSIAPGQARRFSIVEGSMQSGKLHGIAAAVQVVFTHVKVVDGQKGL
jgi:hypothetical protein